MSNLNPLIYEYNTLSDPMPAWMKAERYEYCEHFTKSPATIKSLVKKITDRVKH